MLNSPLLLLWPCPYLLVGMPEHFSFRNTRFVLRCLVFVENKGLEPLTPCVQGRCSKPTELIPRCSFSLSLSELTNH